jgi:DNA-binding HxlR family transcriptional regulator
VNRYGQFCPVAKATEVLGERWTLLIVRELLAGSSRFNELRRGLPGCSPALLTQRLRSLERAGVVLRTDDGGYAPTQAGRELFPIGQGLGQWGQRWARSRYEDDELDASALMWDVGHYLTHSLGGARRVVRFDFPAVTARQRRFWVVCTDEAVDLCLTDPGWPVDATVRADLRALTRVWMGDLPFASAVRAGDVAVEAPSVLARRIPSWFGRNPLVGHVAAAR